MSEGYGIRKTVAVSWTSLGLAVILVASLWLRLSGIDWDALYHLHPDERYIVWVGTTIELPSDWDTALDPTQSTFNPFQWPPDARSAGIRVEQGEPRAFAYGHWPLYLGVAATHLLANGEAWASELPEGWTLIRDLLNGPGRIEYDHMLLVGRALAALSDTVTVALVFLIGRQVYKAWVGLLAAAFVALAVLHIQNAHFFVTDPFLTTAVVAALYWMVRRIQGGGWREGLAAGSLVGLAVGAKFSAVLLVVPLAVALFWGRQLPQKGGSSGRPGRVRRWWRSLRRPLAEMAAALTLGALVFAVTNPFALLDNTCEDAIGGFNIPLINRSVPPLTVHSCYLENIGTQGAMVRGGTHIPFTFQYIGTTPYLYYLDQMFRWALGPGLALAGFGGFLWAVARMIGRRPEVRSGEMALLAWTVPFFLVTGSFEVKFLRYLLPLTPFLAIYGAAMLSLPWRRGRASRVAQARALVLRRLVAGGALALTFLWAAAFVGMYHAAEHPWVAASCWIGERVPDGSTIVTEHWDYALPVKIRGLAGHYESLELEWFYVEDRLGLEKNRVELETALSQLAEGDYLVLASNRLYGVIPRLPDRFPEGAAYYRLLFSGELGWKLVHWSGRYPELNGWVLADDTFSRPGLPTPGPLSEWEPGAVTLVWGAADESYTVYDHPLVLIFENRARLSADEMAILVHQEARGH
jgi:hypothetical protein